jgi:PKD repeat protein
MYRHHLVAAVALLASAASAQLTVTIPAGLAAAEGNSSNAFPWNRFSATLNLQQQMFYDSTHFTSQGINGPIVISRLKWRANATTATWAGGTQTGCWVDMSTAAVDQAAVTTNMASNHGPNLVRVFSGNVTVLGGTGNGTGVPGPTMVDLPITPFVYDPTVGDLCIDAFVPMNSWPSATGTSLDVTTTAPLASRVFNSTNAAQGTITLNHGTVVEIEYTPAAGLYPAFQANVTTGNSPLSVNFTDQTYSSAPGGVLAWQWDFDGDNVVDSTLQNPTFVYNNCGTYTVSLTVVDALHPTATETKTGYIVVDPIAANFTSSVNGGFTPLTVNFTDTSTGPIAAWQWDFDGDNVIDSTLQNPSWIYGAPGTYTVSLTIVNACRTSTRTRNNLISVLAPGTVPAAPEILQYQFNEVRGLEFANTASTNTAPAQGTTTVANWWSDAGRPAFRGNEPGFGCLGYRATGAGFVNTGIPTTFTGSFSISFWLMRDLLSTGTNPFGYAFGNGTFRAFAAGAAGQGITFRGSAIGNVDSVFPVINTPGVWQHLTLVVDDTAGQALWYDNGVPSSNVISFTPNTFSYVSATLFGVGAQNATGASPIGTHYSMDDFRFYSRALTSAEVLLLALLPENASAGATGTTCPGTLGTIAIGSTGGAPTLGNAAFTVTLNNAEDNRLAALAFGFTPATFGLFDLSPWIGAGCQLGTDPSSMNFYITAANSAQQGLAIPSHPSFAGLHIYAQWVVLGTQGATSKVLDINFR